MSKYYLKRDGEQHGPFPTEELKRQVSCGEIKPDELVCAVDDEENWVAVGSLTRPTKPRATMLGHSHSHSAAVSNLSQRPVTMQQVNEARLKMNLPILDMIFSIAVPIGLSFTEAQAKKSSVTDSNPTSILPLVIVVCVCAFVAFALWFRKTRQYAAMLKATYEHQQG